MRYYIATKLERHVEHNQVRDLMSRFGHQITYDWTDHGPVWRSGENRIREVAELASGNWMACLRSGGGRTHTRAMTWASTRTG